MSDEEDVTSQSARMKADIRAVEAEKLKARLERFVASVSPAQLKDLKIVLERLIALRAGRRY
jgi:hypothetical protein